jgi:SAM-dependent methyltransferase
MIKWSDLWRSDFVSYRRYLLDRCLEAYTDRMRGVVLDVGGKRERKRGWFCPPATLARQWLYVNIAPETRPDIIADATAVPMPDGCADCVICTEVLEHLPNATACVEEAYRLLKPTGVLLASVPFLYPVHADPFDFQRFTEDGLLYLCRQFSTVRVLSMGGFLGTVGMLIENRSAWPRRLVARAWNCSPCAHCFSALSILAR